MPSDIHNSEISGHLVKIHNEREKDAVLTGDSGVPELESHQSTEMEWVLFCVCM